MIWTATLLGWKNVARRMALARPTNARLASHISLMLGIAIAQHLLVRKKTVMMIGVAK
jgi:hypothetical protein